MSVPESHSVLHATGRYARFNRPSTNLVGGTHPHPDDIRRPRRLAEPTGNPEPLYTGRYARFNWPSSNLVGGTQPYPDDTRRPQQPADALDEPEFFTLRQDSPGNSTFTIPKAPDRAAKSKWLGPGESITIEGMVLPGGLFYAGSKDATFRLKEPSFIDASLPVDRSPSDSSLSHISYWPSYGSLPPQARFRYLEWIADGRCAPEINIGYVLLFFYGLERRAVVEAANDEHARADIPAIKAEVERLIELYGENLSFRHNALRLIDYLAFPGASAQLYLQAPPAPLAGHNAMSVRTRVALGQMAADKYPLNAGWALTWALSDPYIARRTPVVRCPNLFHQLFRQGFEKSFPRGLKLLNNKTRLRICYEPASSYLVPPSLPVGDIPDVSVTTGARNKLQLIADECCLVLDAFSRYLARNPDRPDALEGILLLPIALWPQEARQALEQLQTSVGDEPMVMTFGELTSRFKSTDTLPRDKAVALAKTLETLNIGLEPDVLSGSRTPKAHDIIALFTAHPEDATLRATAHYHRAVVTLDLASLVATADGNTSQVDVAALASHIDAWNHLSPAHRNRLKAHLRIQLQQPPTLASLKKKFSPLTPDEKHIVAKFLAHLAQAGTGATHAKVKLLERVYKALQLDPQSLYSDLHGAPTSSPGINLHRPGLENNTSNTPKTGIVLDMTRVAQLQRETAQVSALLATVFQDENQDAPVPVEAIAQPAPDTGSTLYGLDIEHSAFLRLLVCEPQWSRQSLQEAAADLDLMLDGALEQINDMAFELFDMPISEGDDPIEINPDILSELTL